MVNEITLTKGAFTVTIGTAEIDENYSNKLSLITPPQVKNNQDSGPKDNKIIDLLRVTHEFLIRGYLTGTASKTAKEVREDLRNIFKGAQAKGGVVTMVYDGDSYTGYIEKVGCKEVASDEPGTMPEDAVKYSVQVTFVEGVSI